MKRMFIILFDSENETMKSFKTSKKGDFIKWVTEKHFKNTEFYGFSEETLKNMNNLEIFKTFLMCKCSIFLIDLEKVSVEGREFLFEKLIPHFQLQYRGIW